jgi:hypothetical protein
MKPKTTDKSGETAGYGGRAQRQYFPGAKKFMKRRRAKSERRLCSVCGTREALQWHPCCDDCYI